jgi:hypothetical protein
VVQGARKRGTCLRLLWLTFPSCDVIFFARVSTVRTRNPNLSTPALSLTQFSHQSVTGQALSRGVLKAQGASTHMQRHAHSQILPRHSCAKAPPRPQKLLQPLPCLPCPPRALFRVPGFAHHHHTYQCRPDFRTAPPAHRRAGPPPQQTSWQHKAQQRRWAPCQPRALPLRQAPAEASGCTARSTTAPGRHSRPAQGLRGRRGSWMLLRRWWCWWC